MTSNSIHDAAFEALKRLPTLTPDAERADRVRMRCRSKLVRRPIRTGYTGARAGFAKRVLAPLALAGFGLLYVAALVMTTLRLRGLLH